jgi:hypothetical protein
MLIRVICSLLLAVGTVFLSTPSFAQVVDAPTVAPPELPAYEQPICPGDGYIWTPGYWAWDGEYYWVPGTWVMAPEAGYLWTPGYWGWGGAGFMFGSEQEFGGNRILGRFRQMVIFRPDRRHALAFSSRYRRFLYPNEGEVGSKTFRQVRVFG